MTSLGTPPTIVVIKAVSQESVFWILQSWQAGKLVIINLAELKTKQKQTLRKYLAKTQPQELDPKTWLIAPSNFVISFGG